jgi:hypothetical protein
VISQQRLENETVIQASLSTVKRHFQQSSVTFTHKNPIGFEPDTTNKTSLLASYSSMAALTVKYRIPS